MKAFVYRTYGSPDVLALEDVEKPTAAPGKVLVRVCAVSINSADDRLMKGETVIERMIAGGIRSPGRKTPGVDVAGVVEAAGAGVTGFQPGDAVFGDVSTSGNSGFAEYVTVLPQHLAPMPVNLTFEQAAAVPVAGVTALQGLRDKGGIQPGQDVLITGASGGVGSFAVQLAKHFGASVTAVCSTSKAAKVREMGADRVFDYTREDVTKSGLQFDLILDIAAYRPLADYRPILKPGGRYVLAGGAISRILKTLVMGPLASMYGGKTFTNVAQKPNRDDLLVMKELLEARAVVPVIDRCYPFDRTIEAFQHYVSRRACGKIVVSMTAQDN